MPLVFPNGKLEMNSFCIIGLGKFGQSLAENLSADGKQVMIIDVDADRVNMLADTVTNAIIGDPTNEAVMRAASIADYECAIITITQNINDNILLTLMCKEFGVKTVVSRAINEGHRKVLSKIGADYIVFPEKDMGERLAFTLGRDRVTDFMEFRGYQIVEILTPKKWIGKTLLDLDIRKQFGITVVAVTPPEGETEVSPSPTRVFTENDRIAVVGTSTGIDACIKKYNLT